VDGYGVTKRFEWHAQSAAARLGCGETGQKAVWFWLDRVRRDAPKSHLRTHLVEGSDGSEQLFSVEVLDICGLSADYCRKCEADEISSGALPQSATTSLEPSKKGKRRGRRPDKKRRAAIRKAIAKHGDRWRDLLSDVFTELDTNKVPLGDFQSMMIDLGGNQSLAVSKWEDLDYAVGDERRKIIDVLRKYSD
jgi:hypothetical protein